MPSDSRDSILAAIRSSIHQPTPHPSPTHDQLHRDYRRSGSLDQHDRLQLFAQRLREYDAAVTFAEPADVPAAIDRAIAAHAPHSQSSTQSSWVVAHGFPTDWLSSPDSFLWEPQATVDALNQCSGVITTCAAAIALSGTIVLQHGPGEGRRQTSLLPDRHLCLVRSSQVVETVPEAFDRLASAATRPLTFISGPSATADIEMTRIRGVHGPRHLDVFIVNL